MVIASLWLDDMEVVFAPAGVNVGVAGVLLFLPFVMGFQRSCRVALVPVSYTHLDVYKRQVFIFVLDMGVAGAAFATVLSQLASAVFVLRFLRGNRVLLRRCV